MKSEQLFGIYLRKMALDFDLITSEILKREILKLPRKGIVFLTFLFNGIIRTSCFPDIWKVSQIIMIHKKNKPNSVSSYRPISLLLVLSKLFEKFLFDILISNLRQRSHSASSVWLLQAALNNRTSTQNG